MEAVTKTEYHVRELATRTVTLFPARAQIVRDLKNLPLKPGTNEVTILGLTPTVDETTIKVEGTGSAVISDIAIDLLPNRDIYQDIYPDSDDSDVEMDLDDDEDVAEDELPDSPELEAARTRLFELRDEERRAKEIVESAASRLKILDAYGKSLDRNHKKNVDISESIDTYRAEREKAFQDHMVGIARGRDNTKHLTAAIKEEARQVRIKEKHVARLAKEKKESEKQKEQKKQKEARRRAERQKERERIRKERERFWPRVCYAVKVTLEAQSFTPASSRRTSVSSDTAQALTSAPESDSGSLACDLSLSYVTECAFWAPTYDLQLSTTNNSATICYDASITNETCETWSNCKVILSTSQANFAGLENEIPTLKPWKIKLGPKNTFNTNNGLLNSSEERQQRGGWQQMQQMQVMANKPRSVMFGVDKPIPPPMARLSPFASGTTTSGGVFGAQPQAASSVFGSTAPPQSGGLFGSQAPAAPPAGAAGGGGGLFGSNNPGVSSGGLFGGPAAAAPAVQAFGASAFGAPANAMASRTQEGERSVGPEEMAEKAKAELLKRREAAIKVASSLGSEAPRRGETMSYDAVRARVEGESLDFDDSAMEETGFTTTYDLPGTKTLPPRSKPSKQRVARLNFTNVEFGHTVVAKYKPVAYLKAKVRNSSRLTLLKGAAGLTLDGTFMGRTRLPLCSAGAVFSLSLGVDPAITVNYPKVDVRRATTGFISKENSSAYTRTITIGNSRAAAGKSVSLLVLDQVPVSEDERLRVDILAPKGLLLDGSGLSVGAPGRGEKEDANWGRASASLKKSGQVEWEVNLNAGKAVKLRLEYVVAMPSGESAVEC